MTEPHNFVYQATARGFQRQANNAQMTISDGRRRTWYLRVQFNFRSMGKVMQQAFDTIVEAFYSVNWNKIMEQVKKGYVKNEPRLD